MPIWSGVGSSGSVGPTSGGKVTPINNIGTTGAQIIGGNPSRVTITFHNPGTNTVYVYPMTQASGAALAPTLTVLGGTFVVLAASLLTFTGEVQVAWGAFATAGAANPLTVMESNI